MIKVVFLDFDNTLYSHYSNSIPSSTAKALAELRKNNIKVVLSTGRAMCELNDFDLSSIELDGYICNNGQLIYDENKNIIINKPITGKLKDELIKRFNEKKVPLFFVTETTMFSNFINKHAAKVQEDIDTLPPEPKEYEGENIYMCSAFYDNDEDCKELYALQDVANVTYWHDGAVDIVPLGTTKANGVKDFIEKYDIKQEETLAFGDGDNDVEMLKYCKIGIAVGNSYETAIKAADIVCGHIEEDGIYNILKELKLI